MSKYVPEICRVTNRAHELSDLVFPKSSGWSTKIKCRHCKEVVRVQA